MVVQSKMKYLNTWTLMITCCWTGVAKAQLQLLPDKESQCVFAGDARKITVVFRNPGSEPAKVDLRARLYQTATATAVLTSECPWKELQVLAGQTVVESAPLVFPLVKAETPFLVQWMEGTHRVIGKTEALVYPTNLLAELKPLADENQPIGVFDPGNVLKPLLRAVGVEFEDLADSGIASFHGKLAIIGPFTSREQMPGDLTERIEKLARKGIGVVWIQPPFGPHDKLKPSFYTVPSGTNVIVVAQSSLLANLAEQPQSQLRLLQLCRLALHPEPLALPTSIIQP